MILLLALLPACLLDRASYERRLQELLDSDADGSITADEGGDDCNDHDASVHPGAPEVAYDGVDQDCDGADLVDVDGDGESAVAAGGTDCQDDDAAVHPGVDDVCYDGLDADCAGDDDDDCDGDGSPAEAEGGADCDDSDPEVYTGAPEGWHDQRNDNDCDGRVDDQVREPLSEADRSIAPPTPGGRFGSAVALIPDGDGDGLRELAISAPEDASVGAYGGVVYLARSTDVSGTARLQLATAGARLQGEEGDLFGASLAAATSGGAHSLYVGALGAAEGAGTVFAFDRSSLSELEAPTDTSVAYARFRAPQGASYFGSSLVVADLDGDGVDDLAATSSIGLSIWLDPPMGDVAGDSATSFFGFQQDGRAHWFLLSNPGDTDGDGLNDLGVTQGGSGEGEVGAALYQGAAVGLVFPDGAFATFVGAPTFGETAQGESEERVVVALLWQASAYVDLAPGAYDPLVDSDYQLFRTSGEEAFNSAVYTNLGIAGPGYLLGAPLSPTGVETGECVFWPETEWRAAAWSSDMPLGLVGAEAGDRACWSLKVGDDYDADGERDVLVGAILAEGGGDEGRVYVQFAP